MTPRSLTLFFWPHWALLLLVVLSHFAVRCCPETRITTAARKQTPKRISWDTNITLLGDAFLKNGDISLTRDSAASAGRALYSSPIRFLELNTRSAASFSSRFAFSITPLPPGDGLAFLLTSDPQFLGSPNGFLGLFSDPASAGGRYSYDAVTIGVEFDTNLDAPLRDINDNHVAVDVGSIFSFAAADAGNAGINLKAGIPMMAWVEYSSAEKVIRVWLSYSRFRPPDPLLVAGVDLSALFREFMYVGFSASNSHGAALHVVTRWSFRAFGFTAVSPAAPAGNGTDGVGCANCSTDARNGSGTDDESVNLGDDVAASLAMTMRTRRILWVVLSVGGVVLLVLLIAVIISCLRGNKKEGSKRMPPETAVRGEFHKAPAWISLDEIRLATKEFHCSKIIGQGCSATVYEGVLPSACKVAVKKFSQVDRFTRTFATELAAAIGSLRHRNLVPLKGWCCEKGELVLVYEYMPNGSLDKILHGAAPSESPLAGSPPTLWWDQRWKIILDVASALVFLHEECEKKIIHRDVKACNVLLDAEFNAKLGDFGLAELNDHNRTPVATKPAGTMGYLAPEYVHSGVPTEKSDVYSFGILALEVATGRKPVDKGLALVDWVWSLWGRRRLVDAADPRLGGRFSREVMRRMLVIGLCCAHPDSKRRPTMRKAVRMLKGAAALTSLPARKPAVRLLSQLPKTSQDSSSQASGDATTSVFSPCISLNQLEEENSGGDQTAASRTPFF